MKNWKNLIYILRHKWFVFLAGIRLRVPPWRLLIHDWSKFTPAEWPAYADYFFAPKNDKCPDWLFWEYDRKSKFERAWLHHQHRNPHHWEHWLLRNKDGGYTSLKMPEHFAREMLADWAGAGRAITGKWEVRDWYEKNKANIALHASTRACVEDLLRQLVL